MKRLPIALIAFGLAASMAASAQTFKLNDSGYFENAGANLMVFSDMYPEGHQGGITLVVNGERRAANGDVRFEVSQGQWQGLPKLRSRKVDQASNSIIVTQSYPDSSKHMSGFNPSIYPDFVFNYTLTVTGVDDHLEITAEIDRPMPEKYVGKLGLNIELVPSILLGKYWLMDDASGIFPHQPVGPTMSQTSNMEYIGDFNPKGKADLDQLLLDRKTYNPMIADDIVSAPLAIGHRFVLNPDDDSCRTIFEGEGCDLKLYDGRINHNNGWFILRSEFPAGKAGVVAKWIIRPAVDKEWRHESVVQTSQVGYHPNQSKIAVIELDKRETSILQPVLYRITAEGRKTAKTGIPTVWGDFMRYRYLQFDFSDVKQEGLYQVQYGDSCSPVFRIASDIWNSGIWQTELEYFLPVQMCHMRVTEKYKVWHDTCHMDDALMAKTDINHIDGYTQGPETLTDFEPGDHVDGLAVGGWHDAGDYDLRVESQATEAYQLAMMFENLGAYWDETAIDFDKHTVEIHQPDGKNDVLQQVENGALTIVAGWDALGRLYRGIICPTVRQYTHLGDAAAHTDGIVGTADDRWVFTENNPSKELTTAAQLAGISRALKGHNDYLSGRCLEIAKAIFDNASDTGWAASNKIYTAVELWFATKDKAYSDYVLDHKDMAIRSIRQNYWYLSKFDSLLGNADFHKAFMEAIPAVKEMYDSYAAKTPYGVTNDRGNRSSGSWEPQSLGYQYAWLCQYCPEVFTPDYYLSCIQYLLGMHPGQNRSSFVAGIGSETMKQQYGVNRGDWSYVPGGVSPGTNTIRPDLPELLQFPFLWQEGEYCIDGHNTSFSYMVLAADRMLNNKR